jgi:hypothetical protein
MAVGCNGSIFDPGAGPGGSGPGVPDGVDPLTHAAGLGPTGVRRLTRAEYRATIHDLTGIDPGADVEFLPQDAVTPFDNDYTTQEPSRALVEGVKAIADRAADTVVADAMIRDRVVGCTPSGPDDVACLESFVRSFGRRAVRRPLGDDEVAALLELSRFAVDEGDFYVAVRLVLRALLQDMELVYRIEIGEPAEGGVLRLGPYELASRMSYFLWGSTPDDRLLDAAAAGDLSDAAGVRAVASEMLADPRAAERVERFHALWLGYDSLRHAASLATSMRAETDALVRRVVIEERGSWLDLFRADETFVDDTMAEIYGLPLPGTPSWVSWGETGRRGILSQAAFLSGGAKFGDTSPVLRGILVRERLLCQDIPPPPPTVNVDEPPAEMDPADCKEDRYAMHRSGGCASCHSLIDPIGFGLEQYDATGRFRTHDEGREDCVISGQGELVDLGATFNGPAELADTLVEADLLDACAVSHLFQFTAGRTQREADVRLVSSLGERFTGGGHDLAALLLDVVSSEAFRHRVVDEEY